MSEFDPPARDPAFAAVARARAAEQAFAVGNPDGLAEARAALAATIATTLPGLAAITGFVREMARESATPISWAMRACVTRPAWTPRCVRSPAFRRERRPAPTVRCARDRLQHFRFTPEKPTYARTLFCAA
jgi:hypothetical protein